MLCCGCDLSTTHHTTQDFSPVEEEGAAATTAPTIRTVHKQTFRNAHTYNIHSLSVNCDGDTFFSADDLRINMWNVQRSDECMSMLRADELLWIGLQ